MKGFKVSAQMTRCSALVDGGVNVGFHTKELPANEKVEVMNFHNQAGWLLFSPEELKDEDVPSEQAGYETKTPSQRLRAVLYILYQQSGDPIDFDSYYRRAMENIITSIKSRLEQ